MSPHCQLKDRETRAFIYDFIKTNNVLEQVKSESSDKKRKPPAPPTVTVCSQTQPKRWLSIVFHSSRSSPYLTSLTNSPRTRAVMANGCLHHHRTVPFPQYLRQCRPRYRIAAALRPSLVRHHQCSRGRLHRLLHHHHPRCLMGRCHRHPRQPCCHPRPFQAEQLQAAPRTIGQPCWTAFAKAKH